MSVTTEPGEFPSEETVRVDGEFAGRIRRMSSGTYYAYGAQSAGAGLERSDAVRHVTSEFRDLRSREEHQEALDAAVARDQESYRRAVEADENGEVEDTYDV